METSFKSISKVKKESHPFFNFFLNKNEDNFFIHEILCTLQLPGIGKYSRDSYEMFDFRSLVCLKLQLLNEDYFYENEKINIPDEIKKLINVKDYIENNTNNNNLDYVTTEKIVFYFSIINNKNFQETDKNNIINNIVPHLFLFKDFDFSNKKRLIKTYPICIGIPKELEKNCGVSMYIEPFQKNLKYFTNINFNSLRNEYSSVHLIKNNSIGLSPNNLKFLINKKYEISHFFLVILDENKINNYVFYYWIINSLEMQNLYDEILKSSNTLSELIEKSENILGSIDPICTLKNIFNIK